VRHRQPAIRPLPPHRRLTTSFRAVVATLALLVLTLVGSSPTMAADGLTMEATALLDGHARTGQWMAIDVHLVNDGPAITGELRLAGGAQGRTRFSTPVDLPTQSDKVYRMYIQPPAFGRELDVALVDGATTIATVKTTFTIHDATQLVVGIVAERPGEIIGSLDLLPDVNNVAPLTIALDPTDLPERVEAWSTLDRLIWQDVDAARLTTAQLDALRGWVAGGGRLVIAGGTSGPSSLSAFPDQLLPYRPSTTTDVAASTLVGLLGEIPDDATDLPALTGELAAGRALATSGDRVVAAELPYGAGNVTIIGFDPTVDWIAESNIGEGLWRRLLPARTAGGPIIGDDSQLVSAASQLPSLALPPIGGLIALLGAYILLIGPINYLVLKRLDRREWAWVTMPVLIVAFAVGAYGFGSLLRGSDLIINEVAIVRGAPGATEGTAQIYLGVFSPTRGSYQLRVPGGALLSSPTSGDFFGGDGSTATLDVLQGDPARIRDLGVGFGSLRTVRAETAVSVPLVEADIRLEDGRMKGTVRNASAVPLLKPAVVLGGTVATLDDLAPGATATIDVAIQTGQFGQQLSDKVVGPVFFGDPSQLGGDAARLYARHAIVDQLTYDPTFGGFTGQMPADGPVILAWSDDALLPVEIEGQTPRRTGNVLYFLPTGLSVSGTATFRSDLIRSTVVSSDAGFFNKDPYTISLGLGSAEIAYRPIAFEGQLHATELAIGLNFGEPGVNVDPTLIEPLAEIPEPCPDPPTEECQGAGFDGMPEVELYDLSAGAWKRLPHLDSGLRYAIADPGRYVDPGTGTVLIKFLNERSEGVGFGMDLSISGELR
jgi:hypothetical protein